jgi:hypothetical protein
MSGTPPAPASTTDDADVEALLADIDSSLADFDNRLKAEMAAWAKPAPKSATTLPSLSANTELAVPDDTDAQSISTTEASPFLAELERAAAIQRGGSDGDAVEREIRARALHEALGRLFNFFNAFCRHANALAPAISRPYRLDAQTAFENLQWQEASVRYRLQNLREQSLMDHVTLTIRLAAPSPLEVIRRWDQVDQLRKEMHIFSLREHDGEDFAGPPKAENVRVLVACDLPVQLTFRANYRKDRVDLLSRNLDGFGIAAFTCPTAALDQRLLDDLGRFLIDRSDKLPAGLQPVHFRSQL